MSFSCTLFFTVVSFINSQQFNEKRKNVDCVATWWLCDSTASLTSNNLLNFFSFQKPAKVFISSRQQQHRYLNTAQYTVYCVLLNATAPCRTARIQSATKHLFFENKSPFSNADWHASLLTCLVGRALDFGLKLLLQLYLGGFANLGSCFANLRFDLFASITSIVFFFKSSSRLPSSSSPHLLKSLIPSDNLLLRQQTSFPFGWKSKSDCHKVKNISRFSRIWRYYPQLSSRSFPKRGQIPFPRGRGLKVTKNSWGYDGR